MTPGLPIPLLAADGGRRPLILAGRLFAPMVLTRSQVGGARSTSLGPDGAWREFDADQPRPWLGQSLLIGQTRTNGVRNPRAEGAASGLAPTNWIAPGTSNGVTGTIIGAVTVNGMVGVEVEYTGTASAQATLAFGFDAITAVAAAPGQVWTGSAFYRLSAGTWNGLSQAMRVTERTGAGVLLVNHDNNSIGAPTDAMQRAVSVTAAFGGTAGAVSSQLIFRWNTGVTANCRIQYFWPQLELGGFASTPVLPAVGSPAASTRGRENIEGSSIGANGAGAILFRGVLDAVATGTAQTLAQFCDNTLDNSVRVFAAASTAQLFLARTTAGVETTSLLGTIAANTLIRGGFSHDGAGNVSGALNTEPLGSVTGAPTSGYTTTRIGSRTGGAEQAAFRPERVFQTPPMADGALAATVAGL